MPAQNDTFWHLRAGQDIWLTHAIPRVDGYSHTFAGAPWPDHEWLSQALMYAVYWVAGMPGLEIGAAALVMGAAALTWRLMVGTAAMRAVLMTAGLSLSSCVWVLRPHVLTLFLLAAPADTARARAVPLDPAAVRGLGERARRRRARRARRWPRPRRRRCCAGGACAIRSIARARARCSS